MNYRDYLFASLLIFLLAFSHSLSAAPREIESAKTIESLDELIDPPVIGNETRLSSDISWTQTEAAWLKSHPTIRVHNELNWPPFNYNKKGVPAGYSIEYMNLLANRMGITIEYITGEWGDLLEKAFDKQIDVMLNIVKTQGRQKHLLYTGAYAKNPNVIMALKKSAVKDIFSLAGKKVAYPKGFFYDDLLKEKFPAIQRVPLENTLSTLKALQFEQVDAVVGELAVIHYLMRENLLTGLEIKGPFDSGNPEIENLNIAVRNDWPQLQAILKKVMDSVSEKELKALQEKWLGDKGEYVALSQKEQAWLEKNPKIKITVDPDWLPLERLNPQTGKHEGIIADHLKLISKRSGVTFEVVPTATWQESVSLVQNRRADGYSGLKKNAERARHVNFSKPYINLTDAIIMRQDAEPINGLDDLSGKRVGVVKAYWTEQVLKKEHSDFDIFTVVNTLEGLNQVAEGELDAFVGDTIAMGHLMNKHSLLSLKFAASAHIKTGLRMGIRNDWPPFALSIINKAIDTITEADQNKILQEWGAFVFIQDLKKDALQAPQRARVVTQRLVIKGIVFILAVTALMGVLYVIIQHLFPTALSRLLESDKIIWAGPMMILIFLVIITLIAQVALKTIENQTREGTGDMLQTISNSTQESLSVWIENRKFSIQNLARDPQLIALTRQHLAQSKNREMILKSESLKALRQYFLAEQDQSGDIGFFIISPDKMNIASMRDANIGYVNLIEKQRPEQLDQAFSGETVLVLPVYSDISLNKNSDAGKLKPPTMFFAAPIKDATGRVIAVLTLRIDPARDFTRLAQVGRIGITGETYVFDEQARMISKSRFQSQLTEIGLITGEKSDILNLRIINPGGNLIEGYRPKAANEDLPLTRMAQKATQGESGTDIQGYRDYRGVMVLGSWIWNDQLGFGLATEIDVREAIAPYYTTRLIIIAVLGMTVFLTVVLTIISLWLGRRANKILIKAKDELEEKVGERTIELMEREEALWDLYENAPVAYASIHWESLAFEKHNKSFAGLLSYDREDFTHLVFAQLISDDERDALEAIKGTIEKKEPANDLEAVLKTMDGRLIHTSMSAAPVFDDQENPLEIRITLIDITDRKNAEMALSEAKDAADQRSVDLLKEVNERKEIEEKLRRNMDALERFRTMSVGRETRMIRLKEEINQCLSDMGQAPKYKIVDKGGIG